jgi:hypothetical protein
VRRSAAISDAKPGVPISWLNAYAALSSAAQNSDAAQSPSLFFEGLALLPRFFQRGRILMLHNFRRSKIADIP